MTKWPRRLYKCDPLRRYLIVQMGFPVFIASGCGSGTSGHVNVLKSPHYAYLAISQRSNWQSLFADAFQQRLTREASPSRRSVQLICTVPARSDKGFNSEFTRTIRSDLNLMQISDHNITWFYTNNGTII